MAREMVMVIGSSVYHNDQETRAADHHAQPARCSGK